MTHDYSTVVVDNIRQFRYGPIPRSSSYTGRMVVKCDGNDVGWHLEENSGSDYYKIGVNSDGDLTFNGTGSVGIGTSSPTAGYLLDVSGKVKAAGIYTDYSDGTAITAISTTEKCAYFYRNSNTAGDAVVLIKQDHTGDANPVLKIRGNGTGDLLNILDGSTEVFSILDGGQVGINATAPTAGYKLEVGGNIITDQTVDQEGYPSIYANQTAETLQDGSASTGTDEAFDNQWEAIKFTASGDHNIRSFSVRLKVSSLLSNVTNTITGYLYSDVAGSPGSLIDTGQTVKLGALTTSYVEYHFGGIEQTLADGTDYWLVLKYSAAPTGGTISIDIANSGTSQHAYSADGSSWTTENSKTGWFKIYGRTYDGIYSYSSQGEGINGNSLNSYGVYGFSNYSHGVRAYSVNSYGMYASSSYHVGCYGTSAHSYGVYGLSTNLYGVYGNSVNSTGVRGGSTDGIAVHGVSVNGDALRGESVTGRSGYITRNSNTATDVVCYILQDHTGDTNTVFKIKGDGTGDLLNILDGSAEVFAIMDGGGITANVGSDGAKIGDGGTTNYLKIGSTGNIEFFGSAGFYPRRLLQSAQPTSGSASNQIQLAELKVWTDSDDGKVYLIYNDATSGIKKVELT